MTLSFPMTPRSPRDHVTAEDFARHSAGGPGGGRGWGGVAGLSRGWRALPKRCRSPRQATRPLPVSTIQQHRAVSHRSSIGSSVGSPIDLHRPSINIAWHLTFHRRTVPQACFTELLSIGVRIDSEWAQVPARGAPRKGVVGRRKDHHCGPDRYLVGHNIGELCSNTTSYERTSSKVPLRLRSTARPSRNYLVAVPSCRTRPGIIPRGPGTTAL